MNDYSYDDLRQMQEKALERVRNMQMHSQKIVEEENRQSHTAAKTPAPRAAAFPPTAAPPQKATPGRIKMPLNMPQNRDVTYPSFREYFEPETQKVQKQTAQKSKANLLDTVLEEPDEAILFSLLLLLKTEGADEALMMALLYIMS